MTVATTEQGSAPAVIPTTGSTGANLIREAAAVMADAHALAKAVCNTAMVPKHFQGKPDDTAAAMLYGASLGLDPMQAVRAVYVVHGQPGLSARSMDALTKAAGHEVWTEGSTDDAVTVCGRRKGSERIERSTWTIERATKAGYVPTIDPKTGEYRKNQYGKLIGNEKYLTDPQAMLHAKATAEVCRKIAPDVLSGVYAVEELQSERWEAEVVSSTPNRGGGLRSVLSETSSPAPDDSSPSAEQPSIPPISEGTASAGEEPLLLNTSSKLAKAMYASINDLGIADNERIPFIVSVIDRQIESTKEMTEDEARAVLDHVKAIAEPVDAEVVEDGADQ